MGGTRIEPIEVCVVMHGLLSVVVPDTHKWQVKHRHTPLDFSPQGARSTTQTSKSQNWISSEKLPIYCLSEPQRRKTRSKTCMWNMSLHSPAPPKDMSSAPNGNQLESGKDCKTTDEGMRVGNHRTLHISDTDSTRLHKSQHGWTNFLAN